MSKKVQRPNKEELESLYSREGTTISSLGRHYSTTAPTVRVWLKHYGIERKSHHQACIEANNRQKKTSKPSKKELGNLYENNSIKTLEGIYSVGQKTIYGWLDEYGIERKTLSESCAISSQNRFKDIQFSKEYLEECYENFDAVTDLADDIGISRSHALKLFKLHDIAKKPLVNKNRSKAEIDLFEFLHGNFPNDNWISNDRSIIFPLELDIVNESKKIAIEYCGIYWHSEGSSGKHKNYHKTKYDLCREKGYKLITVFETDDMEKIKIYLLKLLGKSERIYARKTVIKIIDSKTASQFHNQNHLHNSIGAKFHYGLFSDNELVMVGSFGKNRFSNNHQYECTRLTSGKYTVVGGVSKLFKHFIREENPDSLITFADLRFGDGSSYLNCGMEYVEDTSPNYWYFLKGQNRLYSRVKFQKHKLEKELDFFDPTKTEFENMLDNNWDRIWDCGNAKYQYKNIK